MIKPQSVATDGYIGCDSKTISIASNGYICITIEPVPPVAPGPGSGGYLVKGLSRNLRRKQREKYHDKNKKFHQTKCKDEEDELELRRITVVVMINGKNYVESKVVEDMPNITVKDIDVQVNTDQPKPKITITVIKK